MSHHGLNMLPGLAPLERTGKAAKKRRVRKRGVGEVVYAEQMSAASAIGELDYDIVDDDNGDGEPSQDGQEEEVDPAGFQYGRLSGRTMGALLEAQERK